MLSEVCITCNYIPRFFKYVLTFVSAGCFFFLSIVLAVYGIQVREAAVMRPAPPRPDPPRPAPRRHTSLSRAHARSRSDAWRCRWRSSTRLSAKGS